MEEDPLVCDCNKSDFWFFGSYMRCTHCYAEFKFTQVQGQQIPWKRKIQVDGSYSEWIKVE